jgi:two-component system cell cycle response regulator
MSARVLVVDDIAANVRLLEAKLAAEYFEVLTASSGPAALALIAEQTPDIVLLDVMMPGMDGLEVCRRIKADIATAHLPVVMVTALSDVADRVRGLEAGADDFLTKPVNDLALFARVRSLVRLKMMMDEWKLREETCGQFELLPMTSPEDGDDGSNARVLLADDDPASAAGISETLAVCNHALTVATSGQEALALARSAPFDLVIVSLLVSDESGLRLCSQLRSQEDTRHVPVLLVVDEHDTARLAKGLDIGASDYLMRPIDRNELIARTRTQIRRRRYQERLRQTYERSLSLALTDSLTGLYNRRYIMRHLDGLLQRAGETAKPISLLMFDVDRFKSVNDRFGHIAGDVVLQVVSRRVTGNLRTVDMVARIGGEEFVVVMPDTPADAALGVAERVRERIAADPVVIPGTADGVPITVSIGVATSDLDRSETVESLLTRADAALYRAKAAGRNQVASDPPAAAPAEAQEVRRA